MARNKYPEETIKKIIETSARLFMEKGYENTSIQDIINNLGGLSKGAIYHHFRSKEEILHAVSEHIYRNTEQHMQGIWEDTSLNGTQKLTKMLEGSVSDEAQKQMFSLAIDMMNNPKMLTYQLKSTVDETAKLYVYPLLLEAMKDGSMPELEYPLEFAEAFMLLANIWINPMVYPEPPERIEQKCRFLQKMIKCMGIDSEILNERVIQKLCEHTSVYFENRNK